MQPAIPDQVDAIQDDRLACARCGSRMMLVRVEPSGQPDHDLRTFECLCGRAERLKIRLK